MSNLVHNERIKLSAAALNGGAVALFAVGVLAPLAAALYHVIGAEVIRFWTIVLGIPISLVAAGMLHGAALFLFRRLKEDGPV